MSVAIYRLFAKCISVSLPVLLLWVAIPTAHGQQLAQSSGGLSGHAVRRLRPSALHDSNYQRIQRNPSAQLHERLRQWYRNGRLPIHTRVRALLLLPYEEPHLRQYEHFEQHFLPQQIAQDPERATTLCELLYVALDEGDIRAPWARRFVLGEAMERVPPTLEAFGDTLPLYYTRAVVTLGYELSPVEVRRGATSPIADLRGYLYGYAGDRQMDDLALFLAREIATDPPPPPPEPKEEPRQRRRRGPRPGGLGEAMGTMFQAMAMVMIPPAAVGAVVSGFSGPPRRGAASRVEVGDWHRPGTYPKLTALEALAKLSPAENMHAAARHTLLEATLAAKLHEVTGTPLRGRLYRYFQENGLPTEAEKARVFTPETLRRLRNKALILSHSTNTSHHVQAFEMLRTLYRYQAELDESFQPVIDSMMRFHALPNYDHGDAADTYADAYYLCLAIIRESVLQLPPFSAESPDHPWDQAIRQLNVKRLEALRATLPSPRYEQALLARVIAQTPRVREGQSYVSTDELSLREWFELVERLELEEALPGVVPLLEHGSFPTRRYTIDALLAMGSPAAPTLQRFFQSEQYRYYDNNREIAMMELVVKHLPHEDHRYLLRLSRRGSRANAERVLQTGPDPVFGRRR